MIKITVLLLTSLFSCSSYAHNFPSGKWSFCFSDHPKMDFEHQISFEGRDKIFDYLLIDEKNEKYPCLGNISLGITRKWIFKISSTKLKSKLLTTDVIPFEKYVADLFSEHNVCKRQDWKKNMPVRCKEKLPFDIEKIGSQHISSWKLINKDTLELTDEDGSRLIYKKIIPK